MTSHDARLAQILLAPSEHSNYFALTAILEYDLAKQISSGASSAEGKTTCVANTDVSKKISKCQQLKTWSLQKHIDHTSMQLQATSYSCHSVRNSFFERGNEKSDKQM